MPSSVQSSIKKVLSHFYMDVVSSLAFISRHTKKKKKIENNRDKGNILFYTSCLKIYKFTEKIIIKTFFLFSCLFN